MEYIERSAMIAAVDKHLNTVLNKASDKTQLDCGITAGYDMAHRHCIDVISAIPAADVREVVHGKWIPDDETGLPICSNCFSGKPKSCVCTSVIDHHLHNKEIRYCYFCGADMRVTDINDGRKQEVEHDNA